MIDDGTLELMHLVIDGVATPAQREALERRLQDDAAARAHFASLERVAQHVNSVPAADPPSHLFHRIIAAVPFGRAPWAHGRAGAGGLVTWLATAWRRPVLRFAGTFGLGLAAGAVAMAIAGGNWRSYNRFYRPLDISEVSGTMKTIETADGFEEVASLGVDARDVSGRVRLHRSEGMLLAEVDLNASGEIEWSLTYDADHVSFDGFRRLAQAPSASSVDARANETRVRQHGDDRYLLFFTSGAEAVPPMTLRVYSADALVFEQPVAAAGGE